MKKAICLLLTALLLIPLVPSWSVAGGSVKAADAFDALRLKWYDVAVGGDYDPSNPYIAQMLDSLNSVAQDYLDRMNRSPVLGSKSTSYLWPEFPLGNFGGGRDSNYIHFSYQALKSMARAYQMPGCALYKSPALRDAILWALDYLYTNHFNENVTSYYGNWFAWQIGAPLYLCETTLLMYDELSPATIAKYSLTARSDLLSGATGANALWTLRVRMYCGILEKDPAEFTYISNELPNDMKYVTAGDGYHADGTFVQHTTKTYNGGYGNNALSDITDFIYMFNGTQWALTGANINNIYDIIYNSYDPIMYDGLCMDAFRGREITRTDSSDAAIGCAIMGSVALAAQFAPEPQATDFKSMLKQWTQSDFTMNALATSAETPWYMFPMNTLNDIVKIKADPSVPVWKTADRSLQMEYGARSIHYGDDFGFIVSMYSKRIANYETGDSNNKGWYTGLGMTYLYNNDLGQFGGLNKCTIDWYRLPGVTARNTTSTGSDQLSTTAWNGGTTLDGRYGAAGMDLAAPSSNVTAKKSWFMFDDKVVALGAGITDTGSTKPVETTFDNRMLNAAGDNQLVVDGTQIPSALGTSQKIAGASWLHFAGNAAGSDFGIYFPQKTDLNTLRETRSGKWTDLGSEYNTDTTTYNANWLTLWQDHGVNPTGGSYEYVVLPNKTTAETQAYAGAPDITVLRNDTDAQAVYDTRSNVVGVNFWNDKTNVLDFGSTYNYIASDRAASIMTRETNAGIDVSVSDPTQENAGYINVEINRSARSVISKDARVQVVQTSPTIKLKINANGSGGVPMEVKLSYAGEALPLKAEIQSFTTIGNALQVTLAPDPNAMGYIVRYGETPGVYTGSVTVSGTNVVKIFGLKQGKTYYFAASAIAFNGAEGPQSDEYSASIDQMAVMFDDYADFSKILYQSGVWVVDPANPQYAGGDATKIKRNEALTGNTPEYIVYYVPGAVDFNLTFSDYRVSATELGGTIQLYGSGDNVNWTPLNQTVTYVTDPSTIANGNWYMGHIANNGPLPADTNFIKIVVSNNSKIWAPQLVNFSVTHVNDTTNCILFDSMYDDSRMFDNTGNVKFAFSTTGIFDGDRDMITKTGTDPASVVYSVADVTSLSAVAYLAAGGGISFSYSTDGNTYTPITDPTVENLATTAAGFVRNRYSFGAFPADVKYIKVNLTGPDSGVYLSEIQLGYQDIAVPIERIHFGNRSINAVVGAQTAPSVKIAPMNGYGDITYTTSNPDIAAYDAGLLTPMTIGTVSISVSVNGMSDTVPVRVFRNLAQGKTATGASATSYGPNLAVDGSLATRWQASTYNTPLTVDLGSTQDVAAIQIFWQQFGKDFTIQSSDDNSTWTDIYSTSTSAGGVQWIEFASPVTARYFRVVGGTSGAVYSIYEFRILSFEAAPVNVTVNLALNKPAYESNTASKNANDVSLVPSLAVDGNTTTRWASPRSDNQWFYVDLGAVYTLTDINILWENAYGKTYDLQVCSNLADGWTTVVSATNSSSGWKYYKLSDYSPTPVTGWYVRMMGYTRGTTYGFSMYEFQVFGYANQAIGSISLDSADYRLLLNQSFRPVVTVTPSAADQSRIVWTSSNPNVATVDSSGKVTALTLGTSVIRAASSDDASVYTESTVTVIGYAGVQVPAAGVTISAPDRANALNIGDTANLTAVVSPTNASNQNIVWTSSDNSVAIVDAAGTVYAIGNGTVTITAASAADNSVYDTYGIAVGGGSPVTISRIGSAVTAEFTNTAPGTVSVDLIVAAYDLDGKLVNVRTAVAPVAPGGMADVSIDWVAGFVYKAFAWDVNTYAPICSSETLS